MWACVCELCANVLHSNYKVYDLKCLCVYTLYKIVISGISHDGAKYLSGFSSLPTNQNTFLAVRLLENKGTSLSEPFIKSSFYWYQ